MWQLEQNRKIRALREQVDKDDDIVIDNCQSVSQATMDLSTLSSCVNIVQHQQEVLTNRQEQDASVQHNINLGHWMKLEEVEKNFSDQVAVLRKSQQELCAVRIASDHVT